MKSHTLDDIKNENVDLERIPMEDVFQHLSCSREGLTTAEGEERLRQFGPNKLEEKKVATAIAVYATWGFARIKGCGWGWAGVIWLYSVVTYIPLDFIKYAIGYVLSGKAWGQVHNKTAFTAKKDFGKGEREAEWAYNQRTMHGLNMMDDPAVPTQQTTYGEMSVIAEQARRRAEVARLREIMTQKGKFEAAVKLKGLDIDSVPQGYTL